MITDRDLLLFPFQPKIMDNYTSQRRNYYGGNGNRNVRSSNGSYNNRNSYNSFNGVNGRYNNNRNNGYNGYNGGRYNNNRSISYNSYYSRNSSDDRSDRMETFAAYDNVYRTEIATEETEDYDDIPIGVAYIIFKPVPNHPFWDHPVRFHGRLLQVDYQNIFIVQMHSPIILMGNKS
ncbi:hypothetical protein RclHR1_18010005 [Rhizophagus clarus]|uniref:Uncharacterized protein n=1 Tax=Rhizophagus clarus TaxID=94130 RepID=A0A2Z6QYU5_9GLOM|nr:hypothetical protein RclHR1_18010005 [Rhizophagus clarus]